MTASEKSHEIVNNFCKYVETGNKALITKYSLEELKQAKYQCSKDSSKEFYKAIEDRIKELEKISDEKKRKKEKWLDRTITFILGVLAGLLIAYLKGCFQLK
ncbi:MAG: hypothetical protein Q8O13_01260 [Candidatus Omnitrophota bacterium]|nr:hypothetical protein [Candidatus Omnitrophota bacterium]